jgi:hypothetical protein
MFYRQLSDLWMKLNRVFYLNMTLFGIFLIDYIGDNIAEEVISKNTQNYFSNYKKIYFASRAVQ